MPINAGERSDQKLLERLARQKAAMSAEVLKGIMSSPFGREWMNDLIVQCHIGQSPFSTDPIITAFNCGEQNIGLRLWAALMTTCPDLYTRMTQESNERSISLDLASSAARANNGHVDSDDAGSDYDGHVNNYDDARVDN